MQVCAIVALFAAAAFIGDSVATRRHHGGYSRGDYYINADTNAEAYGDLTDSYGNSRVGTDNYGTRGSFSHGARGRGRGHTGARSSGRINSGNRYGEKTIGSSATADAFGTHNSYSETQGYGESYNGRGRAGASSMAAGSGRGYSRARISAAAGQGIRYKRHVGSQWGPLDPMKPCAYGKCSGSMTAGTNAETTGRFTDSFGSSDVQTDNYGSRGRASFSSRGSGSGYTSSNSGGGIRSGGPYGGTSIDADARAQAYGNMGSFSETRGNAESYNGHGRSGAGSRAGATGFGSSMSGTRASSGGMRRRYRRSPNGPLCIMGRCYESVDTRTGGSAQGDFTESFGDSAISAQNGNLHSLATHQSMGRGYGRTGAVSRGQIDSETHFGLESIGSAGKADAFGENSLSWTSSKTEKLNGASRTQTESKGSASGRGRSAARSEAVATRTG